MNASWRGMGNALYLFDREILNICLNLNYRFNYAAEKT